MHLTRVRVAIRIWDACATEHLGSWRIIHIIPTTRFTEKINTKVGFKNCLTAVQHADSGVARVNVQSKY